jgi:hypothetical protein
MARTTGKQSLADLVSRGILKAGEPLVIHRRSAPDIQATLNKDGALLMAGELYGSPSAAAREALQVGAVDGWLKWRVARLDDRTLADVRDNG